MWMYRGFSGDLGGIYYHCSPGPLLVLYGYIARELYREVFVGLSRLWTLLGYPHF